MSAMRAELCRDELARVARSARTSRSVRAVLLMTRDREEAFALVESVAAEQAVALRHITPASLRSYDAQSLTWTAARDGDRNPADMVEEAARCDQDCVVILEELLGQVKDGSPHVKARLRLADLLADSRRSTGLVLVLLEAPEAEPHAPAIMAAQLVRLVIGYPRAADLDALVRSELAAHVARAGVPVDVAAIRHHSSRIADGLVGLTRKAARDVLNDALALSPADLDAAITYLAEEKARRLSRELSMEALDCTAAEVPAGVENLLAYLDIQKVRMRTYGKARARGVLLVGPPGTGKTMLARALGHLTGLPVVVFRIAALMNSLLGETERLFARAFATLEAMAPCIVFVDEIDKAFGGSGSELDGGTMTRVTGTLLSWLSDNQSPNFVIGTSNNPARLSEAGAMTRSERFDATFFVDVPGRAARRVILQHAVRDLAGNAAVGTLPDDLVSQTRGFSGADLYSCVKHAAAVAEHAGRAVTAQDVRDAIERKRARACALFDEFAPLREWARTHCEMAGNAED